MQDQTYPEGQRLQGSDGNVYVVRNGVPVPEAAQAPQALRIGTPDPYAQPKAEADTTAAQARARAEAAQAPYAGTIAAANAAKAQAEATKAERDLAAQQSTASPQQQRMMADLANDEVLAAISNAREKLNAGWSAGYAARLPEWLQPQNAVDLGGALNTIASRLTLDKLGQLKQASPTGASGLGSLTEKEGALLRDSVAALGQTQSPEVLADNLAAVERHYRNVLALSNGEDYRNPKVAEKYGIVAPPNADGRTGGDDSRINPTLAPADAQYREEPDPALRGVNARVRAMVGAGRSADEITEYLNKISPGLGDKNAPAAKAAVAFRAQNPRVPLDQYVVSLENRQVPMSTTRSMLNSAAQSPLGAAAIGFGDAATAFNLANLTDNPELTRAAVGEISKANPVSSTLGTIGGGIAAGAGIEAALPARLAGAGLMAPRLLASDALYGSAAGYGNGDGSLGSVLTGALEGAAGGTIGRGVVKGIGSGLSGVTNPDAQLLRQAQVPMTVGQMAGGRLARREDRLAGYAGVGDAINERRREGIQGFNRAAFREGLAPIGQDQIANVAEEGIDEARQAVTGAYDTALRGVNVTPDAQFAIDYGAARTAGTAIPRTGPEFGHVVDTRFAPFVQRGQMSGPEIQDMLQSVKGSDFGTDAMGSMANDAMGNIGAAVEDLVSRQAPGVMPGLTSANQAYRNTNILADAVGRGLNTEGLFTPAQLGQASRANATKFTGKLGAASQNRPFFDLQRAGQNVLPSKVPDSGTAGRIEAGKGIFGTLRNAARTAVNAPLYAESTQPILAQLLLDRPDALRALGSEINRRSRIGGLFGAPLLVQPNAP